MLQCTQTTLCSFTRHTCTHPSLYSHFFNQVRTRWGSAFYWASTDRFHSIVGDGCANEKSRSIQRDFSTIMYDIIMMKLIDIGKNGYWRQ